MAALALGAGFGYVFGPLGFLFGTALANLLMPQKGQEGPRADTKTMTSAYGTPIPRVYGRYRVPLQVTWADKLQEHVHHSGGKGGPRLASHPWGIRRAHVRGGQSNKGGPSVTTYTYTATFFGIVCMGPIVEFSKIWVNKQLKVDVDQDTSDDLPYTSFLGTVTQQPWSVAEAIVGVGNVSGHRGKACIGFENWDVGPYGNIRPNIEVEVVTAAGPIPWRVATFDANPDLDPLYLLAGNVSIDPDTDDIIIGEWNPPLGGALVGEWIENRYTKAGVYVDTPVNVVPDANPSTGGTSRFVGAVQNAQLVFTYSNAGPGGNAWYSHGEPVSENFPNFAGGDYSSAVGARSVLQNGRLYFVATSGTGKGIVCSVACSDDLLPLPSLIASFDPGSVTASNVTLGTGDDGHIYVGISSGASSALFQLDETDLSVVHAWAIGETPAEFSPTYTFFVWHGMLVTNGVVSGPTRGCFVWTMNDDFTFTDVGSITQASGPCIYAGGGLLVGTDGIISLNPPPATITLGEIVAAESTLVRQTSYDVSTLVDIVDGFGVMQQGTAIASISMLQNAWPFDAVESSDADGVPLMKFVRRGQLPVIDIPMADLGARTYDEDPPSPLTINRKLEAELPQTVYTKFKNIDADFQDGSQYERRLVTTAKSDVTLDLDIAMTDNYGKTVAIIYLYGAWFGRTTFQFTTSVKYAWLEPTDVITIGQYTMRLTRKVEHATGVIEWEATADLPQLWQRSFTGASGSGNTTPVISAKVESDLVMLDLPLLNDSDEPNGVYAAMKPVSETTGWSGRLYKSVDGTTYNQVDSTAVADVIGTCDNALTEWTGPPEIFDETQKLTVEIPFGSGSLSSVSRDEAFAGQFAILVGMEIIYARDADLVSSSESGSDVYDITGLIRGRRGTDKLTGTHQVGERFVLLPPSMNPAAPYAELGFPVKFKGVTAGKNISAVTAFDFTNKGNALKCYAPCLIGGGPTPANDVDGHFTRRSRIGGDWNGGPADTPLGEATEKYEVEFWDSTYTVCARTIEVTTQEFTYLAADQVTDFGALQSLYYGSVGQVGSYGIGTRARFTVPGPGVVINDPIVSVVPYDGVPSLPPPPPPGGPPPTVDHAFTGSEEIHPTLEAGRTYIYSFTTSATPLARIGSTEFGGPSGDRHGFFSSDGTYAGRVPGSDQYGISVNLVTDILTPSTLWYFVLDFKDPVGNWLEIPGTELHSLVSYVVFT